MLSKILKDILKNYIEEEYTKNIFLGIDIVHFEINLYNSDIAKSYGLYLIGGEIDNTKFNEKQRTKNLQLITKVYGKGDVGFLPYIDKRMKYEIVSNNMNIKDEIVELKDTYSVKVDLSKYTNIFKYTLTDTNIDDIYQYYMFNLPKLYLCFWHYYHLKLDLNKLDFEVYKRRIKILNYIGSKCTLDMQGFMADIDINFKEKTYKTLFEQLALKYEKYIQYLNLLEVFNSKVIFLISHKINFILSLEETKSIFNFYEQYLRFIYSKIHNNVSIELNMYKGKTLTYTLSMIINSKHDDIYYRCIDSKKFNMNNIGNRLEEVYKD